ncbi:hypothetical protein BRD00_11225 [Halobacteriales archaeon QS_8_69_26]|nr:MAG: hypothetical protein BRD00_11225 [Halobacteriales archaeon QS_8_69_26]
MVGSGVTGRRSSPPRSSTSTGTTSPPGIPGPAATNTAVPTAAIRTRPATLNPRLSPTSVRTGRPSAADRRGVDPDASCRSIRSPGSGPGKVKLVATHRSSTVPRSPSPDRQKSHLEGLRAPGMASRSDPIEVAAEGREEDLQGLATWEPRSLLDRFLVSWAGPLIRVAIVAFALLIFAASGVVILVSVVINPGGLLAFVLFPVSVIPALLIAWFVRRNDITREPLLLVTATYLLGIVLPVFALVLELLASAVIAGAIAATGTGDLAGTPVARVVGDGLYNFLVVGPVEEAVKLGAVLLYVYWKDEFDTVIDGAVYGSVAGLAFATIENFWYIFGQLLGAEGPLGLVLTGGVITVSRSLAGPGHVIWSAIAGYALGLAKFNRAYGLPLIIKGLLIASFLHGLYNTGIGLLGGGIQAVVPGVAGSLVGILVVWGSIVVYHSVVGYALFRRLRRYRDTYARLSPGPDAAPVSDLDGAGSDS